MKGAPLGFMSNDGEDSIISSCHKDTTPKIVDEVSLEEELKYLEKVYAETRKELKEDLTNLKQQL